MLWCIAVAVLLAHRHPLRGGAGESLPQIEQSLVNQVIRDWTSEKSNDDPDNALETFSAAGSFYLRGLTGPVSEVSRQSDASGTSISLSSNASRLDPNRTARLDHILDQAASLGMSPVGPQD